MSILCCLPPAVSSSLAEREKKRARASKGNEKRQEKLLPPFLAVPLNFLNAKEQKTWERRRERKQKRGCKGSQPCSTGGGGGGLPSCQEQSNPPCPLSRPLTSLFLVLLCIHLSRTREQRREKREEAVFLHVQLFCCKKSAKGVGQE